MGSEFFKEVMVRNSTTQCSITIVIEHTKTLISAKTFSVKCRITAKSGGKSQY